ncbi:MAG: nucleotidyltransferase family protein [Candidatus Omnitrophota bacterium]
MKALLLCAGYATRLYPLTLNKPKALLEVGGRTMIGRIIDKIFHVAGCDEAYIVTNHRFYRDFSDWVVKEKDAGFFSGKKVVVIDDETASNETRLGAIGDMAYAVDRMGAADDLLVMGSDNLFDFDLSLFVGFAGSKSPSASLALYDVQDLKKASLYGIVILNEGSCEVEDFQEKPREPRSTLAATAIYYYPREKVALLGEYMKSGRPKDAPGNFVKWLSEREKVYGYVFRGRWYDIGDQKSLEKADREYREKAK